MPDLLIELYAEEMPARMQARAASDLKRLMTNGLVENGLSYRDAEAFVTPRRLVLMVTGLLGHSPATSEERKGPRVSAPDKAIEGFLRSTGIGKDDLERGQDKKGNEFYLAIVKHPGRPAAEIVAQVLEGSIRNFPWPKTMRWGDGSLRWVRPLRSILCVISDQDISEVVPLEIAGITASDTTYGHPFMAPDVIKITNFEQYKEALHRAYVSVDPAERREAIANEAKNLAFANGLEVIEDEGLLTEIAGLVEWPVTLLGRIDPQFSDLPSEVLQTSMRTHQKFLSLRNPSSGKIEGFITVANRETVDDGATILRGNQKVLNARLADAKFFWENDLRAAKDTGLEAWNQKLANVTFHNKLGSQGARVSRIETLAQRFAPITGAVPDDAQLAARICKSDLTSEMVYEFPELQGVMGRYYALASGLPDDVAEACTDHYAPLGPEDGVPGGAISIAVALADKLDLLASFWAIDEKPTGSKDPFALRRAALGVIRLTLENQLRYNLGDMIKNADARADAKDLVAFIHDRLKVFMRDRGIRHDVIDACLAMSQADDLTILVARAQALNSFLSSSEGDNLLQSFKRANNIVIQAEAKDGLEYSFGADVKYTEAAEEKALFASLEICENAIQKALDAEDFDQALRATAALRPSVDAFFEHVKVNADSAVLRRNRLNLLHHVRKTCSRVAELAVIQGD